MRQDKKQEQKKKKHTKMRINMVGCGWINTVKHAGGMEETRVQHTFSRKGLT